MFPGKLYRKRVFVRKRNTAEVYFAEPVYFFRKGFVRRILFVIFNLFIARFISFYITGAGIQNAKHHVPVGHRVQPVYYAHYVAVADYVRAGLTLYVVIFKRFLDFIYIRRKNAPK